MRQKNNKNESHSCKAHKMKTQPQQKFNKGTLTKLPPLVCVCVCVSAEIKFMMIIGNYNAECMRISLRRVELCGTQENKISGLTL